MSSGQTVRYKVAEAARIAGVSPSTLRLWEAQGLVIPERSDTGHRQYRGEDVARLKRIAFLRSERGLNPAAIREALEAEQGNATHGDAGPVVPAAIEPDIQGGIGRKLRQLRHAAGKTLEEVASHTGIAPSVLSTLERTSQGVSFKVLHDLVDYFGTTVSKLSGEEENEVRTLVRANEWRLWPMTTPGVKVQVLADGRRMMDCHRFVLSHGASSEGSYDHDGEEFVHVLTGRLELVLDNQHFYDLGPGDSLYFESRRQHSWRNRHDGETVLLWVNTPPTF